MVIDYFLIWKEMEVDNARAWDFEFKQDAVSPVVQGGSGMSDYLNSISNNGTLQMGRKKSPAEAEEIKNLAQDTVARTGAEGRRRLGA